MVAFAHVVYVYLSNLTSLFCTSTGTADSAWGGLCHAPPRWCPMTPSSPLPLPHPYPHPQGETGMEQGVGTEKGRGANQPGPPASPTPASPSDGKWGSTTSSTASTQVSSSQDCLLRGATGAGTEVGGGSTECTPTDNSQGTCNAQAGVGHGAHSMGNTTGHRQSAGSAAHCPV